jgi:hypothetical protein
VRVQPDSASITDRLCPCTPLQHAPVPCVLFDHRYIPADSAPAMGLGNPGILELKMSKVRGGGAYSAAPGGSCPLLLQHITGKLRRARESQLRDLIES